MFARVCLRGRDIVCVGFADWDTELWTNQHHLMSRLAADNRVLFVESLGLRRPQLAGRDLRRIARRLRRGVAPPRAADGLHVLSPLVAAAARPAGGARAQRARCCARGRRARRAGSACGGRCCGPTSRRPRRCSTRCDPSLVVYHCVDDIAAQPGVDAAAFRAAEARFAARADLVLASAPSLARAHARRSTRNVLDAPNVADTALFAQALEPGPVDAARRGAAAPARRLHRRGRRDEARRARPDRRAGARRARDWSFALVGPVGAGRPGAPTSRRSRPSPTSTCSAPRRYAELPAVLRGADAGLIPYAINELTALDLPDEGVRVPRAPACRSSRPSCRRSPAWRVVTAPMRPARAALDECSRTTTPSAAPSARRRRRTRGTRGCARSRPRSRHWTHVRAGRLRRRSREPADEAARRRRGPRDVSSRTRPALALRPGRAHIRRSCGRSRADGGRVTTCSTCASARTGRAPAYRAIDGVALHEAVEPARGLRAAAVAAARRSRGVPRRLRARRVAGAGRGGASGSHRARRACDRRRPDRGGRARAASPGGGR